MARYVMNWSQADRAKVVVYAKSFEEAQEKFENGEFVLEDDNESRAKEVCYGRDDLLNVAETMANEYGNSEVGEELCGVMADAAVNFLEQIRIKH